MSKQIELKIENAKLRDEIRKFKSIFNVIANQREQDARIVDREAKFQREQRCLKEAIVLENAARAIRKEK